MEQLINTTPTVDINSITETKKPYNKVTKLYAFIIKKDYEESILGIHVENGYIPLVGLNIEEVSKIRSIVAEMAKEQKFKYEIRTFQRLKKIK